MDGITDNVSDVTQIITVQHEGCKDDFCFSTKVYYSCGDECQGVTVCQTATGLFLESILMLFSMCIVVLSVCRA